MGSSAKVALFVASVLTASSGCHRVDYRGDGTLSRRRAPAWFCQDEFDVALGPVDLSRPVHLRRILDGLPPGEYTVGFRVRALRSEPSGSAIDRRSPNPHVALRLENERGEGVISLLDPLAEWRWSGARATANEAYVHRTGAATEVRAGPSTTQWRRDGVGADDGWGSYFTARRAGRYTLALDIAEPVADAERFEVELEVRRVVGCL